MRKRIDVNKYRTCCFMGIAAAVIGAGATVYSASQSGKNKGNASTSTKEPWAPAQPYLTGQPGARTLKTGVVPIYGTGIWGQRSEELVNPESDYEIGPGIPGVLPSASTLYSGAQWSPDMQKNADTYSAAQGGQQNQNLITGGNLVNDLLAKRAYDPTITPAAMMKAAAASTQSANLQSARKDQGPVNPTSSLEQLLSGNVTNPYVSQQVQALTTDATRNLRENVMPGIRSGSSIAGQYGGSRQGLAEGLATSRMNQDVANASAGLYSNAYQQAQNNMYGTANALNAQAGQNAQFNTGQSNQAAQFNAAQKNEIAKANASLALANNTQNMALNKQTLGNTMQGLAAGDYMSGLLGGGYDTQQGLLQAPAAYNTGALTNFANVVNSSAGQGGTSSTQTPYYQNTLGNIIGGATAGLGLGQKIMGSFGDTDPTSGYPDYFNQSEPYQPYQAENPDLFAAYDANPYGYQR